MQAENRKETLSEKAKKYFQAYKKMSIKKKTQFVAIVLIIAVILTIYFSSLADRTPETPAPQATQQATVSYAKDDTEAKLKEALSKIDGAGKVEVMITYKSGPEIVPAFSTDTQKSQTTDTGTDTDRKTETENEQTDVVTVEKGGDANALILKEKAPEVKGVIVIAEGAGNIVVKLNLLKAVQTLLAVSPEQIEVFEMKKGK
jgi:stage III sporulation protein AG